MGGGVVIDGRGFAMCQAGLKVAPHRHENAVPLLRFNITRERREAVDIKRVTHIELVGELVDHHVEAVETTALHQIGEGDHHWPLGGGFAGALVLVGVHYAELIQLFHLTMKSVGQDHYLVEAGKRFIVVVLRPAQRQQAGLGGKCQLRSLIEGGIGGQVGVQAGALGVQEMPGASAQALGFGLGEACQQRQARARFGPSVLRYRVTGLEALGPPASQTAKHEFSSLPAVSPISMTSRASASRTGPCAGL